MSVSKPTAQLLTVLQWPKLGPAKAREIARALQPGEDVFDVARAQLPAIATEAAGDEGRSATLSARIIEECGRLEIGVLSMCDAEYPSLLLAVADAPPVIYIRGSQAALRVPGVAVVGTRKAGESGRRAASLIASFVAKRGKSVVSGLALGIDAAAHIGALEVGGITVAVLAHGLDMVAPTSNRPIAERLLATGGALVSEHPPGTPPRPAEFARRNRIQSGLSICSIVVESGTEGGAMIQAKFTRQQGRPLLTVLSRQKNDLNQAGAQRLIAEFQATGIYGTADLAAVLDRIAAGEGLTEANSAQSALEW